MLSPQLPLYSLIVFGCYALAKIGLGLLAFKDCSVEAVALDKVSRRRLWLPRGFPALNGNGMRHVRRAKQDRVRCEAAVQKSMRSAAFF